MVNVFVFQSFIIKVSSIVLISSVKLSVDEIGVSVSFDESVSSASTLGLDRERVAIPARCMNIYVVP